MSTKPTLADVAQAAGVSKMTASRALRGAGDVSRTARDRVERAAEEIGYVGNNLAMSLSSKRTNLIAVVVPSLSNAVFSEVLSGIAEGLRESGLQPVFGVSDYDPEQEYQAVRNMLSWRPAGMIVTGLDQSDKLRRLLAAADMPVVQIMDTDGDPVDGCVGFSHHAAGADMARALLELGHRRFGYVVCGLERDTRAAKRKAGFESVIPGGFETIVTGPGGSTVAKGKALTAEILGKSPELDCLYYSNDDLAMGGLFHCLEQGIDVPGQLRLAGFNGIATLDSLPAPVATTQTQRRAIGVMAARMVLDANTPRHIEMQPDIVMAGGSGTAGAQA